MLRKLSGTFLKRIKFNLLIIAQKESGILKYSAFFFNVLSSLIPNPLNNLIPSSSKKTKEEQENIYEIKIKIQCSKYRHFFGVGCRYITVFKPLAYSFQLLYIIGCKAGENHYANNTDYIVQLAAVKERN